MKYKRINNLRSFTLLELTVTVIIVSVIAAFALPNFSKVTERSYESDAVVQLYAIYNAQQTYYSRSKLITPDFYPPSASATLEEINDNLVLSIMPNGFDYSCNNDAEFLEKSCAADRTTGAYEIRIYLGRDITPRKDLMSTQVGSNPCCFAGDCPILGGCT